MIPLFPICGMLITPEPPTAPVNTVAPSIAGTPMVGQTLTATPGTYTGTPTITLTYQWRAYDSLDQIVTDQAIGGETGSTYVVDGEFADIGYNVYVRETATNGVGSIDTDSNSLGPVVT